MDSFYKHKSFTVQTHNTPTYEGCDSLAFDETGRETTPRTSQWHKSSLKTLLVQVWWSTPVFPTPKRLMEKDSEFEARLKYFLRSCALQ